MSHEQRVLHVITGLNDGGAEAVLHRFISHSPHLEHRVVSMMGPGKYGPIFEDAGIAVDYLEMPPGKMTLSGVRKLWKITREFRPDVFQGWMYHANLIGGIIAKLLGVKTIAWGIHHTTFSKGGTNTAHIVAKISKPFSFVIPTTIICCAESSYDAHLALGYAKSKLVVAQNGYDIEQFSPDNEARTRIRNELEVPEGKPLIGYVARFNPQKDHANLIYAIQHIANRGIEISVALIGPGITEENNQLVKLIKKRGLSDSIKLLGTRSDIPAIMNGLDIHVLASLTEAFPNVLPEAMACGTPCVTTDVGDAAEIVGDTGWVVPPKDPIALADAISVALQELGSDVWRLRQSAAIERIRSNFSVDVMIEKYQSAWNS